MDKNKKERLDELMQQSIDEANLLGMDRILTEVHKLDFSKDVIEVLDSKERGGYYDLNISLKTCNQREVFAILYALDRDVKRLEEDATIHPYLAAFYQRMKTISKGIRHGVYNSLKHVIKVDWLLDDNYYKNGL